MPHCGVHDIEQLYIKCTMVARLLDASTADPEASLISRPRTHERHVHQPPSVATKLTPPLCESKTRLKQAHYIRKDRLNNVKYYR